ncbi:hypothetical protein LCGC14_1093980, partial [marine sediment metagenome]
LLDFLGAVWYTKNMTNEEAAYIAGIIDGEGTISIHLKTIVSHRKHYHAWEYYTSLTLTDEGFLKTIKDIVNQGKSFVRDNPRNLKGRASPSFRIKWSGSRCIALLKEIRPYLRLKSKHADIILSFAESQEQAQSQRSGQGHRYPDWIHNLARDIEREIRKLNARGIDKQSQF